VRHKSENKYLHCTKCADESESSGLAVFVTPTGDLGIQCVKHESFVIVIPSDEIQEHFAGIAMQPCENPECKCDPEVMH
jgi:hypothetical protein